LISIKLPSSYAQTEFHILVPTGAYGPFRINVYDAEGVLLHPYIAPGIRVAQAEIVPFTKIVEGFDPSGYYTDYTDNVTCSSHTSSTLTFEFSSSGFTDIEFDISHSYRLELYDDKQCANLLISKEIGRNFFDALSCRPSFVFTGLRPNTDYWCKVYDKSIGKYVKEDGALGNTSDFVVTEVSSDYAVIGDLVLSEDFSEFIDGGFKLDGACAAGSSGSAIVSADYGVSLYSDFVGSLPTTRLADWGFLGENFSNDIIKTKAGYLEIGTGTYYGSLVTPELSNLPKEKGNTLKLSFDAQPYYEGNGVSSSNTPVWVSVRLIMNSTRKDSYLIYGGTVVDLASFELIGGNSLRTYEFEFNNIPRCARIAIGSDYANNGFCLDNMSLLLEDTQSSDNVEINGTIVASGNNLAGLIKDATTGLGIPNIPVTDGYSYTTTDANGVYQMKANDLCRLVYYSLPNNYKVNTHPFKKSRPVFWKSVLVGDGVTRTDFELIPQDMDRDFTLVMVADPQCSNLSSVSRWKNETIADMKTYLSGLDNIYALTLGDIIFDSSDTWDAMDESMSNVEVAGNYIPIYNCIGNHDHEATPSSVKNDDYSATASYVSHFGPTDYSLDRGKLHIVVMDNIPVTSIVNTGMSNGKSWRYNAGFSAEQYEWLKEDLDLVQNKEDKIIVLCCHIPFREGASTGGDTVNKDKYYSEVLDLLTPFREAHIMIGHTHYNQNYIHTDRLTGSGMPIYEHIHGAACGGWWMVNCNLTGAPNGYAVYQIKDNEMYDWVYKGTGRDETYQLRVYDGDTQYSGSYPLTWYGGGTCGTAGLNAYGYSELEGAFIAEVWNGDSSYWSVELWQNGVKLGDFTKIPNKTCNNMAIVSYFFNTQKKNDYTWLINEDSGCWYLKLDGVSPSSLKNWEVRATQTIPYSGVTHTFTRTSFTEDNSEF